MIAHATTSSRINIRKELVPVFPALAKRGGHSSNIWFFHSPKTNHRHEIKGDVAFMWCVIWEGMTSVRSYRLNPEPIHTSIDGDAQQIRPDAQLVAQDGKVTWIKWKRHQDECASVSGQSLRQTKVASTSGIEYQVLTERDFQGKEIFFDNWLNLCAAINRCRGQYLDREAALLTDRFKIQDHVRFDSLLNIESIDRANMLAVIARALQIGAIEADLEGRLLALDSILKRRSI